VGEHRHEGSDGVGHPLREVARGAVNTMPEKTLLALADHGEIGPMLPHDGGDAEEVLGRFTRIGIDLDALAAQLQRDGAAAFVKSWEDLLTRIEHKSATLRKAG
jgi:transaldolase